MTLKSLQKGLPFIPGLSILLVLLLLPLGADLFTLVNSSYWLISGLLALSLTFIWGIGGIFSFGQTVFFGLGGYSYSIISLNHSGTVGTLAGLMGGIVLAAIFATLLGFFMFYGRVGNLSVAIITLATTLICYNLFVSTSGDRFKIGKAAIGGINGMQRVPTLLNLEIAPHYWSIVIVATLVLSGLLWLQQSHFGQVFNAVRLNEERTELLGYDVRQIKLWGFAIGGSIAGLAGVLHASWGNTISPSVFTIDSATLVIIWAIVGGRSKLWGAFLGAASIQCLSTYLGTTAQKSTPLILGAILIAIVLLLPEGIAPLLEKLWKKIARFSHLTHLPELKTGLERESVPRHLSSQQSATENYRLLETQNLTCQFGKVYAVDDITLEFEAGQGYCIIGPNGAGKSTFFNLLTGRLKPNAGQIRYNGRNIVSLMPHQRVQIGISIKLQVANIYHELSVYDNLRLAIAVKSLPPSECQTAILQMAQEIGLGQRLTDRAGQLSHGEKQWLEIGMAAIAKPRLLLLDEPTGGMSRGETMRTVELLKRLQSYSTPIVIEHNMEFVRQFRAQAIVLAQGKVFKTGQIEEIQKDEQVRAIYLGRNHAEAN